VAGGAGTAVRGIEQNNCNCRQFGDFLPEWWNRFAPISRSKTFVKGIAASAGAQLPHRRDRF
jgi:hypothetical protein